MGSHKQSIVGVRKLQSPMPDSMKLKKQGSGISWAGAASTCGEQLNHYPAFRRNETIIPVHSFVFVMAEGGGRYVGYLEDLYADERGDKKANVRWFQHNRELNDDVVIPDGLEFDIREIFITPNIEAISVDSIEGFAKVLTPTHYEKCLSVISLTVFTQIHMCSRQLVDNKLLRPFSLARLHGYTFQPILACLTWPRCIHTPVDSSPIVNKSNKIKFSTNGWGGQAGSSIEPSVNAPTFKAGQRIEVLSQDSGLHGCWFRCKILKASPKCLKVQYVDVLDAEYSTNLEERISSCRVAALDKLGMRCSGRPTIRPYPCEDSEVLDRSYEIGSAVDAWWCDGWWEGYVVGLGVLSGNDDTLQVYSPGEKLTLTVELKDLRISRDWVGDKWVEIMAKKDILTCISSSAKHKIATKELEIVDENMQ